MANVDIMNIGNTLKLREEIDPGHKVTKWFQQGLNIVDILPADFSIDLQSSNINPFQMHNSGGDYDPIKKFQGKCIEYGLDSPKLLRLWLTGESSFQEDLSTAYETNLFETTVNNLSSTLIGLTGRYAPFAKTLKNAPGSAGSDTRGKKKEVSSVVASGLDSLAKAAIDAGAPTGAVNAASMVAKTLASTILSYKYMSMPKIYTGTSYSTALNFNVRLISPYGHPKAVQKFIVDPLAYLLLLSAPTTIDGLTYGGAQYVTVKAYGIADIPLGIIENISIRRGGNDVSYNKYRQPLSVDVNISIKPAANGFAAVMPPPNKKKSNLPHLTVRGTGHGIALDIVNKAEPVAKGSGASASMTTVGNVLESFRPNRSYAGSNTTSSLSNSPLATSSSAPTNTVDGLLQNTISSAKLVSAGLQSLFKANTKQSKKSTKVADNKGATSSSEILKKANNNNVTAGATAKSLKAATTPSQVSQISANTVNVVNNQEAAIKSIIEASKKTGLPIPQEVIDMANRATLAASDSKNGIMAELHSLVNGAQNSQFAASLVSAGSAISGAFNGFMVGINTSLAANPSAADTASSLTALGQSDASMSLVFDNLSGLATNAADSLPSMTPIELASSKTAASSFVTNAISHISTLGATVQSTLDPTGTGSASEVAQSTLTSMWGGVSSAFQNGQDTVNSAFSGSTTKPNLNVSASLGVEVQAMIGEIKQIGDTSKRNLGVPI